MAKVSIRDWSQTAGSNTDIGSINIDEGWAAANMNNAIREAMAQLGAYEELLSGRLVTGGSANAQTLTPTTAITLQDGLRVRARIGSGLTNTSAMTLNVSGTGSKSVVRNDGSIALTGGECRQNRWCDFQYLAADTVWVLVETFTPALATVNRNATDQTAIADGVWTKVQFNNEVADYGSKYDAATNFRFTPAIPGHVMISASVHFKSVTAGGLIGIAIYKDGSLFARSVRDVVASGDDGRGIVQISALINATASSYFEIWCLQDSDAGAAKDLSGAVADTFVSYLQLPNL